MATGLRVSDVLSLRTSQLTKKQTVRESKTGKTRRVTWPVGLYEQMLEQAGRYWVFESRTDPRRHRARQTVWKDIKKAEAVFKRSKALQKRQNLGLTQPAKLRLSTPESGAVWLLRSVC